MRFEIQKVKHEETGAELDTVVKLDDDGKRDEWCTIQDLDTLFQTCVNKWGNNWDLNKVCTAIEECDFD